MVEVREFTSPFGSFLFPHIFRSFRMAIQPSKLAVAFAAVTVICVTGWLMDLSRTVIVIDSPPAAVYGRSMGAERLDRTTELDLYVMSDAGLQALRESPPADSDRAGVFATLWQFCAVHCRSGNVVRCLRAIVWAFTYHTVYSMVFFAVVLVALSFAGGAICRIAALQFARNERPGLVRAARFARTRLASLIAAPVAPVGIAILLGIPIVALGLIGNIPIVGELLAGLLFPVGLVAGPFIAVVLIGAIAGLNLMAPAVAYEDSDFFDAISRSFSNVYARPWRMAFYTSAAAFYGTVCYLFVRFFTFVVLWVTHGFLQLGLRDEKLQAIWPAPSFDDLLGAAASADGWSLWLAAFLIRIWILAVVGLMISFVISFYFSANTIIYALMRHRVDGTALDEVHVAAEEAAETSE